MSGIVGICDFDGNIDRKLLKDMINIINHRGNDGLSIYVDDKIAVAHCLLDINGEKTKRPIRNESGSIFIILDGLIYNYSELRANLEEKGHKFYSNAEEEVIVHLYEEYGINSVKMIDGEFAFALWDANKKQLILAKDGMGTRPLFYSLIDKKLIFASELKPFLIFGIKREVDIESFYKYINYLDFPESATFIKGIKKLLPGSLMIYNEKNMQFLQYWDISFEPRAEMSEEFIIKELSNLLKKSISKRIKNKSYGIALSSGIDSSCILALIRSMDKGEINTYTLDFDRPGSEFESTRRLAECFDTNHHELVVKPEDFYITPKAMWYADVGKRAPPPLICTHMISNLAKDKKILIWGYGSEHLFCGSTYSQVKRTMVLRKVPYVIRKNLTFLSNILPGSMHPFIFSRHEGEIHHLSTLGYYFNESELRKIFRQPYKDLCIPIKYKDPIKNFEYNMLRIHVPYHLYTSNNQSLPHSQESSSPLADQKLVDFLCKVPLEIRMKDKIDKYLLKKYVLSQLPRNLIPKDRAQHVAAYLHDYWAKEHKDIFEYFLLKLSEREYFNKEGIMKFIRNEMKCSSRRPRFPLLRTFRLWVLWTFELWHEIFVDREKLKQPQSLKEFL